MLLNELQKAISNLAGELGAPVFDVKLLSEEEREELDTVGETEHELILGAGALVLHIGIRDVNFAPPADSPDTEPIYEYVLADMRRA
jgi:hypothetical protein